MLQGHRQERHWVEEAGALIGGGAAQGIGGMRGARACGVDRLGVRGARGRGRGSGARSRCDRISRMANKVIK
jgi:hypothetical protein